MTPFKISGNRATPEATLKYLCALLLASQTSQRKTSPGLGTTTAVRAFEPLAEEAPPRTIEVEEGPFGPAAPPPADLRRGPPGGGAACGFLPGVALTNGAGREATLLQVLFAIVMNEKS